MKKLLILLAVISAAAPSLRADVIEPGIKRVSVCNKIANISDFKDLSVLVYSGPYGVKDEKPAPVDGNCLTSTYMPVYRFFAGGKQLLETSELAPYKNLPQSSFVTLVKRVYKIKRNADGNGYIVKLVRETRVYTKLPQIDAQNNGK